MSREGSDVDDVIPLSHLSHEPTKKNPQKKVNSSAVPYSVFHEGNGFEC